MKFQSRITVFVAILIFLSSVAIANENEDPRDALRAIIDTIKSSEHLHSGTGSASVVIDVDGKKSERILDFKFKDVMSRSDAYALSNGEKGDLEVIWSVNPKNSVAYNGYNALVRTQPIKQFHHEIGFDFHPQTFNLISGNPFETILQNIIRNPGTVQINLDVKGILHIYAKAEFPDNHKSESTNIALDTNKGYKLVSWRNKNENVNGPGYRIETSYEAEWKKAGSQWYIREVHIVENTTTPEDKSAEPKNSTYEARILVNDFVPNPEIQDIEFTLKGLNIPNGTLIIDRIVGIYYKYGSGAIGTENLEGPLLGAEFLKSIKEPVGTNNISEDKDTANIEEQTEEDTKSSVSNKQFSQKGLVPILGQHPYRNVLIVVVLFIGIILVLYIVGKSLLIQKGK